VTGAHNKRVSVAALLRTKPGCRTRCDVQVLSMASGTRAMTDADSRTPAPGTARTAFAP